jgi:acetylornithine deacetylase/succinyl-diaminopimelate desuccinylase-like protein
LRTFAPLSSRRPHPRRRNAWATSPGSLLATPQRRAERSRYCPTLCQETTSALWDAENEEAPLLLLGHYDTVWSAGTLGTMPIETKDGIATGPGVFDMKCGLVQSFWDVKTARELAADLGFDLAEKLAGDASDGCLCAAVGAPVLDGLGAVGAGAHEHVELESVPLRTALVARARNALNPRWRRRHG